MFVSFQSVLLTFLLSYHYRQSRGQTVVVGGPDPGPECGPCVIVVDAAGTIIPDRPEFTVNSDSMYLSSTPTI